MKRYSIPLLFSATLLLTAACSKEKSSGTTETISLSGSVWKCTTGQAPNHRIQTLAFFDNTTGHLYDTLYYSYEDNGQTYNGAEGRDEGFTYRVTGTVGTMYYTSGEQRFYCTDERTLMVDGNAFIRKN